MLAMYLLTRYFFSIHDRNPALTNLHVAFRLCWNLSPVFELLRSPGWINNAHQSWTLSNWLS